MQSRPIALAAGMAALTATGCGEQRIDVAKSKDRIQRIIEKQIGAPVASVACPNEVKVKAKASFACVATGKDGTHGTATVTQIDGKGTISVATPFLHEAEQSIRSDLSVRAPRATVVCQDIIVFKAGDTFECTANLGEVNAIISATQTSANGAFTYTVKGKQ